MKISVLLFAGLRERFGKSRLEMECPPGTTVRGVLEKLCGGGPDTPRLFKSTLFAVNEEHVCAETAVSEGDTVALIPPVAGG